MRQNSNGDKTKIVTKAKVKKTELVTTFQLWQHPNCERKKIGDNILNVTKNINKTKKKFQTQIVISILVRKTFGLTTRWDAFIAAFCDQSIFVVHCVFKLCIMYNI